MAAKRISLSKRPGEREPSDRGYEYIVISHDNCPAAELSLFHFADVAQRDCDAGGSSGLREPDQTVGGDNDIEQDDCATVRSCYPYRSFVVGNASSLRLPRLSTPCLATSGQGDKQENANPGVLGEPMVPWLHHSSSKHYAPSATVTQGVDNALPGCIGAAQASTLSQGAIGIIFS